MTQALIKLSNRLSTFFTMMLNIVKIKADQKTLTHHIVEINKKQASADIINEVALCLKDILNYRLFAFVIKKEKTVDVWLDPRMYKKSIETVISNDFQITNPADIRYLNHTFEPGEQEPVFELDDLVFYEISQENCHCRVYMMPDRRMVNYDDEAVQLLLQSCGLALSRQLKIKNLKDAAVIDPLTGCYNRREFETQLKRHISRAVRYNNPLSLFMFDLDHFKKINDTYGHLAGDTVLQKVANLIKTNMRTGDLLARYGGEEFIAILPETDCRKAIELADRLRAKIAATSFTHEHQTIPVTASFGVSQMERNVDMTRFIQDADTMLYKAKLNGRNTVMPGVMKIVQEKNPAIKQEQRI